MGFCSSCGTPQPPGASYCYKCGTTLVTDAHDAADEPRGRDAHRRGSSVERADYNFPQFPREAPPPQQHAQPRPRSRSPAAAAGRTSIRIVKNRFSVVPPFATGGALDATDDSDNAAARNKRLVTVHDMDADSEGGGQHASQLRYLPPQQSATPRRSRSASTGTRRKGRAMVPSAPADESARDHIFPDTIPEQSTPPRLRQMREDRRRVGRGMRTEAEVLAELPGAAVVRRLRVKKKHLSSKNGLILDEDNYVTDVTPNGPSDIAGVRAGMQIIGIDGQHVANNSESALLMRCKDFGLTVVEPIETRDSPSDSTSRATTPRRSPHNQSAAHPHRGQTISPPPHNNRRHSNDSMQKVRDRSVSGQQQHDDIWSSQGPGAHAPHVEHSHLIFDDAVPSHQNAASRSLLERHKEKARLLSDMHGNGGQGGGGGGGGGRRSSVERASSADSRQQQMGAAAITISPPRSRRASQNTDDQRSDATSRRTGVVSKNLKLNNNFFRKGDRDDDGRTSSTGHPVMRYDKAADGVEIYSSPQRLVYDDTASSSYLAHPVLASQAQGPAPPAHYPRYPVSQPTPAATAAAPPQQPQPGRGAAEHARRSQRYTTEMDGGMYAYDAFTPFQHSLAPEDEGRGGSTGAGSGAETWAADPSMRARTRETTCLCTTAPSSLARAYNCTYCNAPCCMDCYWTGKCQRCAREPPSLHSGYPAEATAPVSVAAESHLRFGRQQASETHADVWGGGGSVRQERHRSSSRRRVCTDILFQFCA